MKRCLISLCLAICVIACAMTGRQSQESHRAKTLDIYFLDMFGGGSTLIVTPLGESVLIDTGSLEPKGRDAGRIHRAAQHAGLRQIDWLITTHFHSDHFGALLPLSEVIPIRRFVDKGALAPAGDSDKMEHLYPLYRQATRGQAQTLRAGEDIPLRNDRAGRIPALRLHCVAAEKKVEGFDGNVDDPVPGFEIRQADTTDNGRSIALVLTFGKFKFFAGGDITWNVEHHLAHPRNIVGRVDLFQVTHHGWDVSNNPLFLQAISPTVCVAMNGPRKGIQPNTFRALRQLASVRAIYQIHYNTQYRAEGNTQPEFIANMQDPKRGEWIRVSVNPDGANYSVAVGENGPVRNYPVQ